MILRPRAHDRNLRVVRGSPSAEELAALVTVLAAKAARAAADAAEHPAMSAWRDRSRLVRGSIAHGPGAWRASAWPS